MVKSEEKTALSVWITKDTKQWLEDAAGETVSKSALVREALSRFRDDVESGRIRILAKVVAIEEEEQGGES